MFSVCSSCKKAKHESTQARHVLRLSKGLVNQEMQMRPARSGWMRLCVCLGFSRYLVMIAGISAKVNLFPDFQVDRPVAIPPPIA
jgi:hypothetical protein